MLFMYFSIPLEQGLRLHKPEELWEEALRILVFH